MNKKPIQNCYWVVKDNLLAGEHPNNKSQRPSSEKLKSLLDFGVEAFIDLTEENENIYSYSSFINKVHYHRFPIKDVSIPKSPDITRAILDSIDFYLSKEKLVYIHCKAGVGRTGVIIGCWLIRHGRDGESALNYLRELWKKCPKSSYRKSPETIQQEEYIINWKEN